MTEQIFSISDEELEEILDADEADLGSIFESIVNGTFSSHRGETNPLEALVAPYVNSERRYSLDDDSVEIVDVTWSEMDLLHGEMTVGFTQSMFMGCSNLDDRADEQSTEFRFSISRVELTIRIFDPSPPEERLYPNEEL